MNIQRIILTGIMLVAISFCPFYTQAKQSITINTDTPALAIKKLIASAKHQLDIDITNYTTVLETLTHYTDTCKSDDNKAIIHSMLAELYQQYYALNSWKISQQTPIINEIPSDIEQWSSTVFFDTIQYNINQSLRPANILQATPLNEYDSILVENKLVTNPTYTLYEFLIYRGINILKSISITNYTSDDKQGFQQCYQQLFKQLINYQQTTGQTQKALQTEIDLLQTVYSEKPSIKNYTDYQNALDSLHTQYASDSLVVDIIAAQIDLMKVQPNLLKQDSINNIIFNLCQNTLKRFPTYSRINLIKNKLAEITYPTLSSSFNKTTTTKKGLEIKLSFRNIADMKVEILHKGESVFLRNYLLKDKQPFITTDTTLQIPMKEFGKYICQITSPQCTDTIKEIFVISNIFTAMRKLSNTELNLLVVDAATGKPIENAETQFYTRKIYDDPFVYLMRVKSNKLGLTNLAQNTEIKGYQTSYKEDCAAEIVSYQIWSNGNDITMNKNQITLFTDRGLYRPGQTVFFKGVIYDHKAENAQLVTQEKVTVILKDAYNKEIDKQILTSNTFGTFNSSFQIPTESRSGSFSIWTENGSTQIEVAPYKRPTFLIHMLPITNVASFGKAINLQGEAHTYAGTNLQNRTVTYKIMRLPFWRIYPSRGVQVADGTCQTNNNGAFSISFTPSNQDESGNSLTYARYEVITLITDSKGETQEGSYNFVVGDQPIIFKSSLPQEVDKQIDSMKIQAFNLNQEAIDIKGTYTLYYLSKQDSVIKKQAAFESNKMIDCSYFKTLNSGKYLVKIETKDLNNQIITDTTSFVLYGTEDKCPPVYTPTWLIPMNIECNPGEDGKVIFGTSIKEAYVLYEVIDNSKIIKQKRLVLNNENRLFTLPATDFSQHGVTLSFTFVKEGVCYNKQIVIKQKKPSHQLTIQTESFKDRLQPGANETFKFRILNPDSTPAYAEVLASMYDSSLDAIYPYNWRFNPTPQQYYPEYYFIPSSFNNINYGYIQGITIPYAPTSNQSYRIDWQGVFQERNYGYPKLLGMANKSLNRGAGMAISSELSSVNSVSDNIERPTTEAPVSAINIRKNLAETAFFYPSLLTDSTGSLAIQFVLPESNTTWKFMLFANTKTLDYGLINKKVISQKELMVLPNYPSFVRNGDIVTWSTQIINQSNKAINGIATIKLLNAKTNTPLTNKDLNAKAFQIEAGGMIDVSWLDTIPVNLTELICQFTAATKTSSDGEQQLIPVYSNKVTVTDSKPFMLQSTGQKIITTGFKPLPKDASIISNTLEYCNNPVWYAVQALPTLTKPSQLNALSIFASYYSTVLLIHLANTTPNLAKIKELDLDTKKLNRQKENALNALIKLQGSNGGWSWYPQMPTDITITTYILKGMSQLITLGAIEYGEQEKIMQINALQFLDKSIEIKYNEAMKRYINQTPTLDTQVIAYLYMRSGYRDIPELGSAREAVRYYTQLSETAWQKENLLNQAYIAQLLYRNGKHNTAIKIINYLKSIAIHSPSKGMYWGNNRNSSSFTSPIEVHCQLMHALLEVDADPSKQMINQLKTWLLSEKQTQDWKSLPGTVEAIYTLLKTGNNWLEDKGESFLRWGGQSLTTSNANQGLENIEVNIQGDELKVNTDTLWIDKKSDAPSWGAIYREYQSPARQVSAQGNKLNIKKEVYILSNNGSKEVLIPITVNNPLRVGDKVCIRLTFETDQTLDYVQISDQLPGCLALSDPLASYKYTEGLNYYLAPAESAQNIFINHLEKGIYSIEYNAYISRKGDYTSGITSIVCLYAPAFSAHTAGDKMIISNMK